MKQIVLIILCGLLVSATQAQTIDKPYDYPIRPGTEEWKQLTSAEERWHVCQIPPNMLHELTTEALARTCLNFPLLIEITLSNNLLRGLDFSLSQFNGFQELLQRNDASSTLVSIYQEMDIKERYQVWEKEKKGYITLEYTFIELLLSEDRFVGKLTPKEIQALRRTALRKFEDKESLADIFGPFSLNTVALILAKLLKAEGNEAPLLRVMSKEDLDRYLTTATLRSKTLLKAIYNESKSL